MTYNEYEKLVYDNIDKSIKNISQIDKKILLREILINWYNETYSEEIKKVILEGKYNQLIKISNEINHFLHISPEEQILLIKNDQDYIDLIDISSKILDKAISFLETKQTISEKEYNNYINRINEIAKNNDTKLFKSIISECLLDLDYLINNGNVKAYSIRFARYLKTK